MASTLKVKIEENIILDNQDYGSKRTFEIGSIANITKKIVTIASDDDATVLVFKSTTAIADGSLDLQNVKYIRITNLDSSNSVNISLQLDSDESNSAADLSITHLLEAGRSFMMGAPDEAAHADDDSASIVTALTDLESIIVDPGSNSGQVEVFVAST
tara:strand:- start:194 stop:667 length:474 start_codon:yes stop_codon:yes gene_type:complete